VSRPLRGNHEKCLAVGGAGVKLKSVVVRLAAAIPPAGGAEAPRAAVFAVDAYVLRDVVGLEWWPVRRVLTLDCFLKAAWEHARARVLRECASFLAEKHDTGKKR
jgi:hypothetical protein